MVADDGGGGAVEVGVHVEVVLAQVALDEQLVLLRVAAADHQVVLARHKPVELLEPGRLAQLLHRRHRLHLRARAAADFQYHSSSRRNEPIP